MTRIGQVGADSPFTDEDTMRMAMAAVAILEAGGDLTLTAGGGKGSVEHDIVNLNQGRDFLTEDQGYDVVIVHSVFNGLDLDHAAPEIATILFRDTECSPHHSHDAWRQRLVNTGAKWIVVCEGQPFTLSGWQLGELEGYERLRLDTLIALYRKERRDATVLRPAQQPA